MEWSGGIGSNVTSTTSKRTNMFVLCFGLCAVIKFRMMVNCHSWGGLKKVLAYAGDLIIQIGLWSCI